MKFSAGVVAAALALSSAVAQDTCPDAEKRDLDLSVDLGVASVDLSLSAETASLGCCASLGALGFASRLVYPGNSQYQSLVDVHWSWAARLEPSCFFLPKNADEVSKGVKAIAAINKLRSCKFAVRSGGHTLYPGAANIKDGITMDLSQLKKVEVFKGNNTVMLQPGARWRDLYAATDAAGVAAPGGRAASVGTAGLILGGGNSFYSARTGFVCDSIANFEVVLANGTIIQANKNKNADLWQALKGGSMNFGIVTRFDMMTLPGAQLWGGVVTYPNSTADKQIDAIIKFGNNIKNDQFGSAITIFLQDSISNGTTVVNAYDYTKPVVRPAAYNDFLAIPGNTSDSTRITNIQDITEELEQAVGFRDTFLTLTFKPDARVLKKALELQAVMFDKLRAKNAKGLFNVQTLFQPIPRVFSEHSLERGGNVLGLDRFNENLMLYQLYYAWQGADQDTLFNGLGYETINAVNAYAGTLGKKNEFIYLDYADINQKALESYGAANVAKIRAVAKKYDPTGFFQTVCPGGFKISNVK